MPRPTNAELDRWAALEADGRAECRRCGEVKPLDGFGRSNGKRRRICKPCTNTQMNGYARKAYAEDPDRMRAIYRERDRRWKAKDPEHARAVARNNNLKAKYGITADDFDKMLAEQGGGCAICGSADPKGKNFHVDHCHDRNVIRGILCHPCNTALGTFGEDPVRLDAAAAYLRRC